MPLARQAAALLRKEFGTRRVVLFGSLASHSGFTVWSDIVWQFLRYLPIVFMLLSQRLQE